MLNITVANNNTRVTEVRSSLGHKVRRATSNLIGSQVGQHCHLLEEHESNPYYHKYKSKKKKKNKPRKAIKTH